MGSSFRKSDNLIVAAAAGILALLGLPVLSVFNTSAFPIDDAFISFRYARNLIDGLGLVFNQGERVEAYSNFLWVLLVSGLGYLTGVSQIVAARLLGWASLTGLCVLLFVQIRRATRTLFLPFAVSLVFMLLPATIFHTLSGMETMLSVVFLLAVGIVLESDTIEPRRQAVLTGLLLAAFSLNRPEGLLLFACILAAAGATWLLSKGKNRVNPAWLSASYACVLVPFLAWRLLYYGSLLPNSVVAKNGLFQPLVVKAGVKYLVPFLIWHFPVVLLAVFAFFSGPRARWIAFRIPASAALAVTALLGGVGDGYPYSRYLYPLFACLVVWSVEGALSIWQWAGKSRGLAIATLGFLSLLGWVQFQLLNREHYQAPPIPNELEPLSRPVAFFRDTPDSADPPFLREGGLGHYQAGRWLAAHGSPGDLLATYEIGIVPYFSRLPVLDLFGLADRHIARNPGLPGQRTDLPYVWSRKPGYIMLRVPSDCLCSTYQIFFDRRLRDDYDLAEIFPYWATDILLFKRRTKPIEAIVSDLTSSSDLSKRQVQGPVRLLEHIQLVPPGERERLLADIRQTNAPEAMRRWIDTWRSAFALTVSKHAERGAVSFELLVPERAILAFGVGVSASQESWASRGKGKARVQIVVSDDQLTETIFERDFDGKTVTAGWEDYRVDLARFASRRARLSFTIENQGIPVTASFAEPRIVKVKE